MRNSSVALLAAAGFFLSLTAAASAAESAFDWSGSYLGATAGAAFGRSSASTLVDCTPVSGYLCQANNPTVANGALIDSVATGTAHGTALAGTAFVGRNWQVGAMVWGLEGDLGVTRLHLSVGGSAPTINAGLQNAGPTPSIFNVSASAAIDWLATARARVGFLPAPDTLVYGTAGIAGTELTVSNRYTDNFNNGVGTGAFEASSRSTFATGLAFGVGVEHALASGWTLRVEYLHVGFGRQSASSTVAYLPQVPAANAITSSADLSADIVRIGMAARF